jgi:hypothetical protein
MLEIFGQDLQVRVQVGRSSSQQNMCSLKSGQRQGFDMLTGLRAVSVPATGCRLLWKRRNELMQRQRSALSCLNNSSLLFTLEHSKHALAHPVTINNPN